MFYFMNLSETFNNKHLDFKQITGIFLELAFTLSVIDQLLPLRSVLTGVL